jgi:hypothetical protein
MALKGKKLTEEHKNKISLKLRGNNNAKGGKAATGYKHTNEWKRKASERMLTENNKRLKEGRHNLWKGGKSSESIRLRSSLEYKLWRKSVFERDKYTCIWCGKIGGRLNADHIKPFAHYPELRFAIDNGRTLCEECHRTTDTFARKGFKRDEAIIQ